MANYHEIPKPTRPKGTEEEYRKQIYNYLFSLAELLQAVLNAITTQQEGGEQNG